MMLERMRREYEMKQNGRTDVAIGKELGVTSQTVRNDMQRLNDAFRELDTPADERLHDKVKEVFTLVIEPMRERLIASVANESTWPTRRAWAGMLRVGVDTIDRLLAEAEAYAMDEFVAKDLKRDPDLLRQLKASKDPASPYVLDMVEMLRKRPGGGGS